MGAVAGAAGCSYHPALALDRRRTGIGLRTMKFGGSSVADAEKI
jgi:hypothetical protein